MEHPTTPYAVLETGYEDAIYICPTTGRRYTPSLLRPAQRVDIAVWVPCFWCDAHGRTRGQKGFSDQEPQPHAYPLIPADGGAAELPACDLGPAFGDLIWTTHLVQTTLRAARLPSRLLEFSAAAEKCRTYRELLTAARRFVAVTGIGEGAVP